jgi:hypothetical protein
VTWLPTSGLYKPESLESIEESLEHIVVVEILMQSHFYAGKLLRNAPLRAISRSPGHLF